MLCRQRAKRRVHLSCCCVEMAWICGFSELPLPASLPAGIVGTYLSSWICQYPCFVTGTQLRVPVKWEGSKPPNSSSPPAEDSGFLLRRSGYV